jgi:hypothetical protein
VRLGHGHHAEPGDAGDVGRSADPAVLDPVPVVGARVAPQRLLVGVEHRRHRPVTDRVGGHLPAGAVGPEDEGVEAALVHLEVAGVAGLALERLEHRRRAPHERAVGEDLGGARCAGGRRRSRCAAEVEHERLVVVRVVLRPCSASMDGMRVTATCRPPLRTACW